MDRIPKIAMEEIPGTIPPAGYRRPMSCASIDELKPTFVLGAIRRGVRAVEVATFAETSRVTFLVEMARDLERNGDAPCIRFYRNAEGTIVGITLCAELSNGTKLALAEV